MKYKTEIKRISCKHIWIDEDQEETNEIIHVCKKCSAIKIYDVASGSITARQGESLIDILGIKKEKLSWKTSLKRHSIIFKKNAYKTEYFSRKNALIFAAKYFHAEPYCFDLNIVIGFDDGSGRKGWIDAKFSRSIFYMGVPVRDSVSKIMKMHKRDILSLSNTFCISRFSMLIKPNSRFEKLAKKVFKLSIKKSK